MIKLIPLYLKFNSLRFPFSLSILIIHFYLLLLVVVSGFVLLLFYLPSIQVAWDSLAYLNKLKRGKATWMLEIHSFCIELFLLYIIVTSIWLYNRPWKDYYGVKLVLLLYIVRIILIFSGYSLKICELSDGSKLFISNLISNFTFYKNLHQFLFLRKGTSGGLVSRWLVIHLTLSLLLMVLRIFLVPLIVRIKLRESPTMEKLNSKVKSKLRINLHIFKFYSLVCFILFSYLLAYWSSHLKDVDFNKPINGKIGKIYKVMPIWFLYYVYRVDKAMETNWKHALYLNIRLVLISFYSFIYYIDISKWNFLLVLTSIFICFSICLVTNSSIFPILWVYFTLSILN